MKRFFKNLGKHPGTWVFLALLSVGIGIAVPPAAPGLIAAATAFTIAAVPTSGHFYWTSKVLKEMGSKEEEQKNLPKREKTSFRLSRLVEKHPIQLTIAILAFVLFVTALVLTIGFFTGGAGFAFMAPVFAAIAAPFAAAAASAGIELALAALAGTVFVLASINIPNTFKRFSAWLDSFIYDGIHAHTEGGTTNIPQVRRLKNKEHNQYENVDLPLTTDWNKDRYLLADELLKGPDGKFSLGQYLSFFGTGVIATVTKDKGKDFFTSPDAEACSPKIEII